MRELKSSLNAVVFAQALLLSMPVSAEPWQLSPQIMLLYESARWIDKTGLDIDYKSDGDDWLFDVELSANSPMLWSRPGVIRHTFKLAKADYNGLAYTLYETGINGTLFTHTVSGTANPEIAKLSLYIGAGAGVLKAKSWFEQEDFNAGSFKIGLEGSIASHMVVGLEWHRSWSEAKLFNNRNLTLDTSGLLFKCGLRF